MQKQVSENIGFFGSPFILRDVLIGTVGYGAAGGGGLLAGVAGAAGLSYMAQTGKGMLQLANILEGADKVMRKVNTVGGTTSLLQTAKRTDLSFRQLGIMFFGDTVNNMAQFEQRFNRMPEWEKFSSNDLFADVKLFGGETNSLQYARSMANMKRNIISLLPTPEMDKSGEYVYTKQQKSKFLNEVSTTINPENFVEAIRNKRLTSKAYNMFANNYPSFLTKFNINYMEALKSGKVDNYYKIFLRGQNSDIADYIHLNSRPAPTQQSKRSRKMPSRRPSVNESAIGGVL